MNKILVLRFSAMGDVALTVPSIKAVLQANPELEITLVTREFFAPFFTGLPRVQLFFPDFKNRHKGLTGLIRLFFDLKKLGQFESIIDLHDVIRSRVVSFLFQCSGIKRYVINKGREEKKFILKHRYIRILKHSSERYLDVFHAAGIPGSIGKAPFFILKEDSINRAQEFLVQNRINDEKVLVGLAPFATAAPKMWGIDKFESLVRLINNQFNVEFLLFGGGKDEIAKLQAFEKMASNLHLVAGSLSLNDELALIKKLDVMVSMDSSNMHLAALSGVPTVSIWGGTHPAFGFYAYGQPSEYSIQTKAHSLPCRPCSVFGNKPCRYQSIKCMEMITPENVLETLDVSNLLKQKAKK